MILPSFHWSKHINCWKQRYLWVWRIAILASNFFSFFFFLLFNWVLSFCRLFVSLSQVLLEFCAFMQLCAVSFFSEFSPCPLVCYISVGNSLIYTCLFLREVIVWSVFPVSALCPAEDLPKIIMFIVPDRGQRGWQQWRTLPPPFPSPTLRLAVWIGKLVAWEIWARFVRVDISLAMRARPRLGGGDSSVVRAPDSWLKGRGFESLLERRENFLLQGRLSVLTLILVSVPPPCYHSST